MQCHDLYTVFTDNIIWHKYEANVYPCDIVTQPTCLLFPENQIYFPLYHRITVIEI